MSTWKQWIVRVGFSTALVLTGYLLGSLQTRHSSSGVVHAQQQVIQLSMPRAWGPVIGTPTGVLIFEDRAGTLRMVAANTGDLAEIITRN